MKKLILIFIFFLGLKSWAQPAIFEDSLRAIINNAKGETTTANVLRMLMDEQMPYDSAIKYATHGILLAKKFSYKKGEADCYFILARATERQNNFSQAIKYCLEALNIYEGLRDTVGSAFAQMILHGCYRQVRDFKKALDIVFRGYMQMEKSDTRGTLTFEGFPLRALYLAEIAQTYILYNKPDSASFYTQKAIDENALFNGVKWNFPVYLLATTQYMQGKYSHSLENFQSAIPLAIQNGFFSDTLQIFSGMSTLFIKTGQFDSAIHYAQMVVHSINDTLPKIEIVPQDIGRVLLNLYNNAFYAVNEQKKAPILNAENYEPTVSVTTKRISSPFGAAGLEISVKDNGPGIPQKVVDKIFQPFFTTKPTGQGTGLGLSLSYDIIKAHGGAIKVETKEGEGSEFIIQFPVF